MLRTLGTCGLLAVEAVGQSFIGATTAGSWLAIVGAASMLVTAAAVTDRIWNNWFELETVPISSGAQPVETGFDP